MEIRQSTAVLRRIISIIPAVIIARSAAYPGQACLPQRGPLFAGTCFFQVKQGKRHCTRETRSDRRDRQSERERERELGSNRGLGEGERIRGRGTSSSTLSVVSSSRSLFLLLSSRCSSLSPSPLPPSPTPRRPSEKRKRRRMLNDPSTSGQPSATLLSSCFSALYGLADRVAHGSTVDADLVEDGCPPLSRPFRLGTLKYYTGRIAALALATLSLSWQPT